MEVGALKPSFFPSLLSKLPSDWIARIALPVLLTIGLFSLLIPNSRFRYTLLLCSAGISGGLLTYLIRQKKGGASSATAHSRNDSTYALHVVPSPSIPPHLSKEGDKAFWAALGHLLKQARSTKWPELKDTLGTFNDRYSVGKADPRAVKRCLSKFGSEMNLLFVQKAVEKTVADGHVSEGLPVTDPAKMDLFIVLKAAGEIPLFLFDDVYELDFATDPKGAHVFIRFAEKWYLMGEAGPKPVENHQVEASKEALSLLHFRRRARK
jgi:hypothetical protein